MLFLVRNCPRLNIIAGVALATFAMTGVAITTQTPKGVVEPQPRVADLLKVLARPCDRVQLADDELAIIEPLASDVLLDTDFAGTVAAMTVAEGDKTAQPLSLTRANLKAYIPFEQHALAQIAEFEKSAGDLPTLDRLTTLEAALAATLRFNITVRQRPLKGPSRWDAWQMQLDQKLMDIRRQLLRERMASAHGEQDWQRTLQFGDDLLLWYPANAAVLTDVARMRHRYAAFLLLQGGRKQSVKNLAQVRLQLDWVDARLAEPPPPDAMAIVGDAFLQARLPLTVLYRPDGDAVRQYLMHAAGALVQEAKQTKDDRNTVKLLETAVEIWPHLPGLRDELLKRQGHYTILNVGVRELPTQFSPAHAVADSELQALELLFESLVQARVASDGSLAYLPQLAASLPAMSDNERIFLLRKSAHFSSGARVTTADVQKTFEMRNSTKLPGRSAELADQLEPIRAGDDPFRVTARLRQGLLDSLAPFTFKVLPRDYGGAALAADNEAFALSPIGSGPYMLAGTASENGRTFVRFVVNPYYSARHDPAGPKIREIRFFVCRDPAADFANKTAPMHLVLDVPTQDLAKLKAAGVKDLRTLPTRRIFFLAANHRDPRLSDAGVRRALAAAINRQQLLADCFGGSRPSVKLGGFFGAIAGMTARRSPLQGTDALFHHALNGPFPAGSWASCADKRVPASLFDRPAAEALLAKTGKNEPLVLTLKYPAGDPRVEQACQGIAGQFADLGKAVGRPIKVNLIALPIHQLNRDLQTRQYQLAYWHHDFPNDAFSLWPLFDWREEALETGSNYLGFKDDGTWPGLLMRAAAHRDFDVVKRLTHDLHDALNERMPLIPLWQLDYHIAVHPNLRLPRVDPLRVFANIDEWELMAR